MTEHKAIRNKDRSPSHPGAAIDDILIDVRVAKTQVAEKLGISRQHLHENSIWQQAAFGLGCGQGGCTVRWECRIMATNASDL